MAMITITNTKATPTAIRTKPPPMLDTSLVQLMWLASPALLSLRLSLRPQAGKVKAQCVLRYA